MLWQTYYSDLQKQIVLKQCDATPVEYGEIIYKSPIVQSTSWLVACFNGEYNVFFDHVSGGGGYERSLGASFCWKEAALEFALKMFLVCSGQLRRQNRYDLTCLN